MELARRIGNEMTGEFLCFAGSLFLLLENYVHMGGMDFDLCSDNRLASTEQDFLFSFPLPVPYKCKIASETVRFQNSLR